MSGETLSQCSAEAQALFDNDFIGVAIIRDGGFVERCNSRLERMMGRQPGSLEGTCVEQFNAVSPKEDGAVRGLLCDDLMLLGARGNRARLRVSASPLPDDGGPRRELWIVQDFAEHGRLAARHARRRLSELASQVRRTASALQEALHPGRGGAERDPQFESRFHAAVKGCRFDLNYQPIVDAQSLKVCSVEALLRWRDDRGSPISPSEFVPLAEASGLIHTLGQWSLLEACRQIGRWRECGALPRPVCVNLSPCQLQHRHFVPSVIELLKVTGVDPQLIELEITETSLMQDIDLTLPQLRRLADHGIRLAIDDFGTGYSSLSYLRQLPIWKLKIDQSFVRELQRDPDDVTIVAAIVSLAKKLGLCTVAEGVETAGQLQILRQLGCDLCQGFHFWRPSPPEELEQLLAQDHCLHSMQPPAVPLKANSSHFDAKASPVCVTTW